MLKTTKRTTALLTAAMSLGIAAPAGAMPFNTHAQGSLVPVEITPPAVQSVAPSGGGGGISDLGYVGIGIGGVAIGLIGGRNGRKPSQDQDDAAPGTGARRHRPRRRPARRELNPPPPRTRPSRPAVQIVRVSAPGGFDWDDATIGAAGALGLSTLAIGSGLAIASRRRRTPGTPSSEHGRPPQQQAAGDASRRSHPQPRFVSDQQEALK